MKTIIAGCREGVKYSDVQNAMVLCGWIPTEVVSGTARGVDTMGERWAQENNIPIKQFPAYWERFGKIAGYKRNLEMGEYADALVAIWDGKSRGTSHMIEVAKKNNLEIFVHLCDGSENKLLKLID